MGGPNHLGKPIGKFALRALLLTLLTVAFIVLLVILMGRGQERIAAENAPAEPAKSDVAGNSDPAASSEAGKETAPAQGVAVAATPLERLPAREPLSVPTGKPRGKSEPKPAFQILARPAIAAPGVIETTRGRVSLKGIVPLPPFAVCGEGKSAWPCGQIATSQLQRFLRARSVNCDIADAFWQGEVTARCMRGNEDVAGWLVENGWVKAERGSAYEAAGREAEAQKRGIFGADPRGH
jgi:endonuclease YncB( thermonuclease family)